jgi:hypothetical protein
MRSALVTLLTVLPFIGYLGSRDGRRLTRVALDSIGRGMGSVRIGMSLLRNFVKRVGSHLLLERIRREGCGYDIILCDEGIVHAAHNLFVHSGVEPDLQAIAVFGRLVAKPDLLIWVTAPTVHSCSVIRQRGHSRVAEVPDTAEAFAEHAQATFEALADIDEIAARLCTVDNTPTDTGCRDATVAGRAANLARLLTQRLHGAMPWIYAGGSRALRSVTPRHGARPVRRMARRREAGPVRTS